jgi:hypothetical protein
LIQQLISQLQEKSSAHLLIEDGRLALFKPNKDPALLNRLGGPELAGLAHPQQLS